MLSPRAAIAVCSASAAIAIAACGGTTTPSTTSTADGGADAASSCADLTTSAREEVASVIAAHLACTTSTDCVSTSFSASCFDSCTRAVRASDLDAVKSAKDRVNAAQCSQFEAKGCKLEVPPCEPPTNPTCTGGVCQ